MSPLVCAWTFRSIISLQAQVSPSTPGIRSSVEGSSSGISLLMIMAANDFWTEAFTEMNKLRPVQLSATLPATRHGFAARRLFLPLLAWSGGPSFH